MLQFSNFPHAIRRSASHGKNPEVRDDAVGVAVVTDPLRAKHARDIRCGDERNDNRKHLVSQVIEVILLNTIRHR